MAEPVVGYLLKKICDFLIEEALFLKDVDKELGRLRDELQRMECFFKDADVKRNSDERVKNWVKDVRRVAYHAEDLVDVRTTTGSHRGDTLPHTHPNLITQNRKENLLEIHALCTLRSSELTLLF